jgi:effector-binding domain-containing protein
MNIRLEGEPEGTYTRSVEEICDCGRHKNPGYPLCYYCSKQKYKEINRGAGKSRDEVFRPQTEE